MNHKTTIILLLLAHLLFGDAYAVTLEPASPALNYTCDTAIRFQNNSKYECRVEGRFDLGGHNARTLEPNTSSGSLNSTWSGDSIITCNNGKVIAWLHDDGNYAGLEYYVDIYNESTNQHPLSSAREEINLNGVMYVLTPSYGVGCEGAITISNA